MKLRNDKEINALFASAHPGGAAVPAAPTEQNSPIVVSVNSACSVGGHCAAWLVHLRQVHPLGGRRGYGRMPYPPTKTPTDCTDAHRLGAKTQPKNL